jgi:hypothetical protein
MNEHRGTRSDLGKTTRRTHANIQFTFVLSSASPPRADTSSGYAQEARSLLDIPPLHRHIRQASSLSRAAGCVDGVRLIGCERAFVGWLARTAPRYCRLFNFACFLDRPLCFRTVQFKSDPNGRSIVRLFRSFLTAPYGAAREG